jgi:hypothetical protein
MPAVELPPDIDAELQLLGRPINDVAGNGVATYVELNNIFRIEVYLGLDLDGYTFYDDISAVLPSMKLQFFPNPSVSCPANVTSVSPNMKYVVQIQVIFFCFNSCSRVLAGATDGT